MSTLRASFVASAAILFLGWGFVGPAFTMGQESERTEENEAKATTGGAKTEEGSLVAEPDVVEPQQESASSQAIVGKSTTVRTAPPRNLKLVGDHWTPYDPPDPESFPSGARLHIIVRGDTLWDLADLTYSDPYLWPYLWNENRYILDSHWIYPGDPLLIPGRPNVVRDVASASGSSTASPEIVPHGQERAPAHSLETPKQPDGGSSTTAEPLHETLTAERPAEIVPRPAGTSRPTDTTAELRPHVDESELLCSGFISRDELDTDLFIGAQEEPSKVGLTEGDIVYLNRGNLNGDLESGEEFSIVLRDSEIFHPVTGDRLGWYYVRLGIARVLSVFPETSVAAITMACDEIRSGYELMALRLEPVPARVAPPFSTLDVEANGEPVGYLVHTRDSIVHVGAGNIVQVDMGRADGLAPGDFLTAFEPFTPPVLRRTGKLDFEYDWNNVRVHSHDLHRDDDSVYPPRILGQLVVMCTEDHTSTAKIIYSVAEMRVGTMVEPQ